MSFYRIPYALEIAITTLLTLMVISAVRQLM